MNVLRRYLSVVIAATILGVVVAAIYSWLQVDQYRATTRLFFTTASANVTDLYYGTQAGQVRVRTYEVLATDPKVLEGARQRAGVSEDAATLKNKIHVDVPPGTIIIDVGVDDPDPVTAANLANAVSDELTSLVNELERPLGGGKAPVTLTVVQPASPAASPEAKLDPVTLALGAVVGFAVGCAAAFAIAAIRARRSEETNADESERNGADGHVVPERVTTPSGTHAAGE